MRSLLLVVAAFSCAHDSVGDGAGSLRGAAEKENRTLEAEATLGACSPDPHCNWQGDLCHCCYNGGCDYEDACRCGDLMMSSLGSQSGDAETGASEGSTELNSTGTLEALASWWCQPVGGVCGGPWKWPKKCCGNAECQALLGGDGTKKCVEKHVEKHCAARHGECGGPGRQTLPCCARGFVCKAPFGSAVMKCMC